jgi:hypothetical protein
MVRPSTPISGQLPIFERLESRTHGMPGRAIVQFAQSDSPGFMHFTLLRAFVGSGFRTPIRGEWTPV